MTVRWSAIWNDVREAVRTSRSHLEALRKVSELRGTDTTWNALARAWRRQIAAGVEELNANDSIAADCVGCVPHSEEQSISWNSWQSTSALDTLVGTKHLVIPDTQVKPGVPIDHFKWIGRYIVDKAPDVVIHLGDHWDMPSLSQYDSPQRKAADGRCKREDIDAGNKALEMLEEELTKAGMKPRKVLLEGNHDGFAPHGRIGRYFNDAPWDEGLITKEMFADSWLGWERVPFLEYLEIDDILYGHLFPFNLRGETTRNALRMGASSPEVQVRAVLQSATAGHKQGLRTGFHYLPTGGARRGIIAGSCYQHDEEYMGPGNNHWRGILVKHDVRMGGNPNHYDLLEVSLTYLKRKYG